MMKAVSFVALCMVALLVFSGETEAATPPTPTCNVFQLSPCFSAFMSSSAPSAACCNKLREQQPCFCQYYNDPTFKDYINNPNAVRVARACNVPYPPKCVRKLGV